MVTFKQPRIKYRTCVEITWFFSRAFLIVNHISRSWRLTSPPSMGTIQEPRASNLFYNVNRWLSNHSMHSKRTHALKPRRFVTMWSGRKMEQSKILTNLVTFATAAKYLTEGLNKYICGGQLIHYTQPNPRFRTTKSVCRIQVQPNPSVIFLWHCLSLYLSFFRSFFLYVCMVHCYPEQDSILWEHHKDL